jgi:hypothetical protein
MKRLLQTEENFYSIHEGLKVAEGLFDLLKRSHDDGDAKLFLDDETKTKKGLDQTKTALQRAIQVTRPLGIKSPNGNNAQRIVAHNVDVSALTLGLKYAQTIVDVAEVRTKAGTLILSDSAIEFGDTELLFTPQEYINFAKRALIDALEKAEQGTLGPEASYVSYKVLEGRPNWEQALIKSAVPLGGLQDDAIRNRVKRAKVVFGFDITKEFEGKIFFGREYFCNLAETRGSLPMGEVIALTFHSELEGHLKLAAAVKVLKGSCDLL